MARLRERRVLQGKVPRRKRARRAFAMHPALLIVHDFLPRDPERGLKRAQNAAEALARQLAPRWDLPVAPLLSRREPARPQRGLSRVERRKNVRGSFAAVARPPAHVALVDDVYTTGATVSAAATELRRAGARSVHVVTFARAVRR